MATLKSSQQAADKYARNTGAAAQYYKDGVQNASGWAAAAVASAARRNAGLQQAMSDGRIDAGIQRTGDAGWKNATTAKAGNWAQGVQQGKQKYQAGIQNVLSDIANAKSAIAGMDNSTFEARQARAATYARAMHDAAVARKTGR